MEEAAVAKAVEKVGETPAPDGMLADADGRIYLAAFEKNAIIRYDPVTKQATPVVEDPRLQWPDSMAWGPEGMLYVTTSQIHRTPKYNRGTNLRKDPYKVFKFKVQ